MRLLLSVTYLTFWLNMIMKLDHLNHTVKLRWVHKDGELKCVTVKCDTPESVKPHPMFPIERDTHEQHTDSPED